jgi:Na+-transporting methylmalonyl-CoA/oxaloacetate decarboxylase gamma subunit
VRKKADLVSDDDLPAKGIGKEMGNWDFGLTLTVLGMGGTMIILFLISLVVDVFNKYLIRGERKREARKES